MFVNRYFLAVFVIMLSILGCNSSKDTMRRKIVAEKKSINLMGLIPWNPKTPFNIEEFRGAWVATVANINWPSQQGLSVNEQKNEATALLDSLEKNNFNAVIFQVRPQADAFYNSQIEPWSYYLTGKQGLAPEPLYDPLLFWIEEAHKRGLELHAWLNPYRAHHTQGGEISENSIVNTNPELVVKLENGMYWMDPSLQETQERSLAVVMDIVDRYDIDGIHFDDYFYPYDSYNNGNDFPDDKSWMRYLGSGGKLSKADWRRENVNSFIKTVYSKIKATKPFVKFGISPFGIWRPGFPETIKGYDQYDRLYADAKLWLNEGWLDYFTPQLYWKISRIDQSFPVLLGWWQSENSEQRHLWPGISTYSNIEESNADETVNQIMITRGMLPNSKGTVHWSIAPLIKSDILAKALVNGPYKNKSLVPPSPWLDNSPPSKPLLKVDNGRQELTFTWSHPKDEEVFRWVLYFKDVENNWNHAVLPRDARSFKFGRNESGYGQIVEVGLTAVDRTGNQSEFYSINID